ncbi:hypothetical protein UlMin_039683 [Ulmus minor]
MEVDWSVLPEGIWSAIGKLLDRRLDIRAFDLLRQSTDAFLSQTTVFQIVRPFEDLNSSSSSHKGWLVKVEETDTGKFQILDPITGRGIKDIPGMVSNSCRLFEFQMIKLIKTYVLRYIYQSTSIASVNKVMLVPNSEESAVFVIYDYGKLGFPKSVDFKVFKLDQDWGTWVEVKNLRDQEFVLSCDFSLSVLAQDFAGFKPNCIYFTKQFDLDCALRGAGDILEVVFLTWRKSRSRI